MTDTDKATEGFEVKQNIRGFDVIEFQDFNGVECRLQISSLATEDAEEKGENE